MGRVIAFNNVTLDGYFAGANGGKGKMMFDGIQNALALKLTRTRTFGSGVVLLCYQPMA